MKKEYCVLKKKNNIIINIKKKTNFKSIKKIRRRLFKKFF